jgi:hypothetical protein
MLIPGHIGFTFGAVYLLMRVRKKNTLTIKNLSIIAFIALLPDIGDKGLHLFFPRYPEHAVFHSIFIYSLFALGFLATKHWKALFVVEILLLNCLIDLENNPPGVLVYPLTGLTDRAHHYPPVGTKILERLPEIFSMKDFTGHYLLFEIAGLIIMVLVALSAKKRGDQLGEKHRSGFSQTKKETVEIK